MGITYNHDKFILHKFGHEALNGTMVNYIHIYSLELHFQVISYVPQPLYYPHVTVIVGFIC